MEKEAYKAANQDALIKVLTEFETRERPLGFISDNQDANEKLMDYMAAKNAPVTVQSVEDAVKAHIAVGHRFYLSPEETAKRNQEQDLFVARSQFNQESLAVFDAWVNRQRHIAWTPQSKIAVLQQMQGRAFGEDTLNAACGRAAYGGHIQEQRVAPVQHLTAHSANPKLQSDVTPENERLDVFGKPIKRGWTPSPAALRFEEIAREEAARQPESEKSEAYYKSRMESLQTQCNTHTQRAFLRSILLTKPGTRIPDYKATCAELERQISIQGSK
jgi:hypothetical protein